jgi:hypothetical protein
VGHVPAALSGRTPFYDAHVRAAEITEPLTTAQITVLKEEQPEWLQRERSLRDEVQREEARLRAERSGGGGTR